MQMMESLRYPFHQNDGDERPTFFEKMAFCASVTEIGIGGDDAVVKYESQHDGDDDVDWRCC